MIFPGSCRRPDLLEVEDPKLAEALKIVANATSYGIWAEVDIEEGRRPVTAYATEAPRYHPARRKAGAVLLTPLRPASPGTADAGPSSTKFVAWGCSRPFVILTVSRLFDPGMAAGSLFRSSRQDDRDHGANVGSSD